jgi:chemotaxis-related protein WspD
VSTAPDAGHEPGPQRGNGDSHALRVREFFDRPPPPGYLEEWSHRLSSAERNQADDERVSVVIVRLHDELLAIPTQMLVEVTAPQPVHVIPHRSTGHLLGLVNIRGQLGVCISLHGLLKLDPPAALTDPHPQTTSTSRLVIVDDRAETWIFPVEEVVGVRRLAEASLRSVPATLGKASGVTRAVFDWKGHSVGLLDQARLLAVLRSSCT